MRWHFLTSSMQPNFIVRPCICFISCTAGSTNNTLINYPVSIYTHTATCWVVLDVSWQRARAVRCGQDRFKIQLVPLGIFLVMHFCTCTGRQDLPNGTQSRTKSLNKIDVTSWAKQTMLPWIFPHFEVVFLLLPDIVSVGTSCCARWATVANFQGLDELFLS